MNDKHCVIYPREEEEPLNPRLGDLVIGEGDKAYRVSAVDVNKYNLINIITGNRLNNNLETLGDIRELIIKRRFSLYRDNQIEFTLGKCVVKDGEIQ